ncbi:GTP pyrophosphokinase [Xiamenia xianingshaonis]|nr:(p)ppGpp synthetase [Xiamenia xianingshaonis]
MDQTPLVPDAIDDSWPPCAADQASSDPLPHRAPAAFLPSDDFRDTMDDFQRIHDAGLQARAIIQKYQAAMRLMEVRFEILDRDLNLKKHRNPIHSIESRIKKPASIFEKLERYGKEPTLENMERYIMDIAGVRVICSYISDVYSLLDLLCRQDDLEIVAVKDYIENPKPNGYRSLHVIVRIPVYFLDQKEMIPVEVQLRTIAMDFWASLEHDLKYKSVSTVQGIDSYDELADCSRVIKEVEARMQVLARALEMDE